MGSNLDEEGREAFSGTVVQEIEDCPEDVRVFGFAESGRFAFSHPVVHFREVVRRICEDENGGRSIFPVLEG